MNESSGAPDPAEAASPPAVPDPTHVVDNAVYRDGRRVATPPSVAATRDELRAAGGDGTFAWIGIREPDDHELADLARNFALPELAVEDAVHAHQRPKIERYGDVAYVVLRPVRYVDAEEDVQLGEMHLFLTPDLVIGLRHAAEPDLGPVRARLESDPELLRLGPRAVLYAVLDRVVDEYRPVVEELRRDIDQIETQVFGGDPAVSRRIYQLSREVIEFQRAADPLRDMLRALMAETEQQPDLVELHRGLRDVADHVAGVTEATDGFRQLLERLLTVDASLVAQRQNEEMRRLSETSVTQGEQTKRISSWAAILFTPSLIGAIYGMNFDHMPELHWTLGYPFALTLMVVASLTLFLVFRRRGWL